MTRLDPATIRHARRLAGLTQAQLAAQLGVTQTTVQFWETGHRHPDPRALRRLTALLSLRTLAAPNPDHSWLTAVEAAHRAGVTRRAIYAAIHRGRLTSRYPGPPFLSARRTSPRGSHDAGGQRHE